MKATRYYSIQMLTFCLAVFGWVPVTWAQTNDPYVQQQQYLFDVHNVDQAWTLNNGSSGTRIGIFSDLGFIQNHEDLTSGRILTPQGGVVDPVLGFASEMVGIIGATTGNGVGMVGIDRGALLQSYSVLTSTSSGATTEAPVSFTRPDGSSATYYRDLSNYSDLVDQARTNGIDIYVFESGIPSGKEEDFPLQQPPDTRPGGYPDPDNTTPHWDSFKGAALQSLNTIFDTICGGLFGSCVSAPNPLEELRTSIGNAVKLGDGVVIAPAADLNQALEQPIAYLPGMFDKYVVAVGAVKYNDFNQLVKWDRTRPASYVDVSGFVAPQPKMEFSSSGANLALNQMEENHEQAYPSSFQPRGQS